MFESLKKLFSPEPKDEAWGDAVRCLAEREEWRHKCDRYADLYRSLLNDYENLSKRYFALKLAAPGRCPEMKGEFAPRCVRRSQDQHCFFRLRDFDDIPSMRQFLRAAGAWDAKPDPDIRRGHAKSDGSPLAWFMDARMRMVEVPLGSVLVIPCELPKDGWEIVPEKTFNAEWLVV